MSSRRRAPLNEALGTDNRALAKANLMNETASMAETIAYRPYADAVFDDPYPSYNALRATEWVSAILHGEPGRRGMTSRGKGGAIEFELHDKKIAPSSAVMVCWAAVRLPNEFVQSWTELPATLSPRASCG